jgi:hypothetical protein
VMQTGPVTTQREPLRAPQDDHPPFFERARSTGEP